MRRAVGITVARAMDKPDRDAAQQVLCRSWPDPGVLTRDVEADCILYLLAKLGGCPAGALRLCISGTTAHFERLSVAPSHRRRGIADQLVLAALTEARAAGCHRAVGFVRKKHQRHWSRIGILSDGSTKVVRGEIAYGVVLNL